MDNLNKGGLDVGYPGRHADHYEKREREDMERERIEESMDEITEDLTNQLAGIMDLSQLKVDGESLQKLTSRSPHSHHAPSQLIDGLREHICEAAQEYLDNNSSMIVDALMRRNER